MATLQYANTYINGSRKLTSTYTPANTKKEYAVYYNDKLNQYYYVDEKNTLYTITGEATKTLSKNKPLNVMGTKQDQLTKASGVVDIKTLPTENTTAYIGNAIDATNASAAGNGTFSGTSAKAVDAVTPSPGSIIAYTSNTNKTNDSSTANTNTALDYDAIYNAAYNNVLSSIGGKYAS